MTEFKLKYPITVDGEEIRVLRMRRASVLDLELMGQEKGDLAKSVKLVSQVADLAPDVIRQMDAADFNNASDVVAGFLE